MIRTVFLFALLGLVGAFSPVSRPTAPLSSLRMVAGGGTASQVTGAMPTAEEWLEICEPGLRKATLGMLRAVKEVAYKIRSQNQAVGDEPLDLVANNAIFNCLAASGAVCVASSVENPTEDELTSTGEYSTAFSPLDGSDVIEQSAVLGTIWGTWRSRGLTGISGRGLQAAGIATYGPKTSVTLAVSPMEYAHEFVLVDDFSARHGEWAKAGEYTTINEGKLFAPGNLRATIDNPGYMDLFNYWNENQYQLRYSGGIVPDVSQIIAKGKGVFVNAASRKNPAKLRLLYEVAPIGFLMEKAGGESSAGGGSVLDVPIESLEQTSQVAFGSADEVERFEKMVGLQFLL